MLALLGGNGTGKTTSLKAVGRPEKALSGRGRVQGSVGVPCRKIPQTLFVKKTVREDLVRDFKRQQNSRRKSMSKQVACVDLALCRLPEAA